MHTAPKVDWRGIGAYVILAYIPTWTVHIMMMRGGVRFDNMPTWATVVVAFTMLFPALAALITRLVTKEGFASAGLRFVSWKPYLTMLAVGPILFGLIYFLSYLFGFASLDLQAESYAASLQALAPDQPLPPAALLLAATFFASLTIAPLVTALFTFGEEFGWTGYLLPKLLPLGKWRATVIYGVIWAVWHAPIIWGGYNYPGYPVVGILMMCVTCTVIGLFMTTLRLRYGSVLMTTWLHAIINTQARSIWPIIFVGVHPLLGGIQGLVGLVILGAVGIWLLHRSPDQETLQGVKAAA